MDIYHKDVRSIGHHIVKFNADDEMPGHAQSLNPNLLRGIAYNRDFEVKYPLGTVHFLMWLLDIEAPRHPDARYLFGLPDSSWINAQSHRFRENVHEWLGNFMPLPSLQQLFGEVDTAEYEDGMQSFFSRLSEATGFRGGRGQVASQHRNLRGLQCTFKKPDPQSITCIQRLADFVAQITGWRTLEIPNTFQHVSGKRNPHRSELAEFLERECVFSYVIPNRDTINYTTFNNLF